MRKRVYFLRRRAVRFILSNGDVVCRGGEATPAGAGRGWLPRIAFKGFCDPAEHYARAKMLLLTSDFEGFGLVLVEAMSAGCVPIALGSYSAVYDIIDDGVCGRILPMPFDAKQMEDAVIRLARNQDDLLRMAKSGKESSARYSVGTVVDAWESVLCNLTRSM